MKACLPLLLHKLWRLQPESFNVSLYALFSILQPRYQCKITRKSFFTQLTQDVDRHDRLPRGSDASGVERVLLAVHLARGEGLVEAVEDVAQPRPVGLRVHLPVEDEDGGREGDGEVEGEDGRGGGAEGEQATAGGQPGLLTAAKASGGLREMKNEGAKFLIHVMLVIIVG